MSWSESLRTALEALRLHRMRSTLTVVGIMIGVAAVILTVGFGQGAQDQVKSQIDSRGSNLLVISPGSSTSSGGIRELGATSLGGFTRSVRCFSIVAVGCPPSNGTRPVHISH